MPRTIDFIGKLRIKLIWYYTPTIDVLSLSLSKPHALVCGMQTAEIVICQKKDWTIAKKCSIILLTLWTPL